MSFLKKILESYDNTILTNLYGTKEEPRKINKPFTFHVKFPEFKKFEGNKIICGEKAVFYFSTNEEILATSFYNSLKESKHFTIGENSFIEFKVKNIWIKPLKIFSEEKSVFKTLAPVLVNKKGDNLHYLSPVDKDFYQSFLDIILLQAKAFNIDIAPKDIEIEIYKMKKLPLTHYRQTMTAWLGEFILKAPKEVLQLVYDTGIGVRRSQGFGMLEKI